VSENDASATLVLQHNLCCDNCHSHVAYALNLMKYDGSTSWNMIKLCFLLHFHGKYVRCVCVCVFVCLYLHTAVSCIVLNRPDRWGLVAVTNSAFPFHFVLDFLQQLTFFEITPGKYVVVENFFCRLFPGVGNEGV